VVGSLPGPLTHTLPSHIFNLIRVGCLAEHCFAEVSFHNLFSYGHHILSCVLHHTAALER
jgi:hypothetical protein